MPCLALLCLRFFCLVVRDWDVYCWVQVCNQYSILIVLYAKRVCVFFLRIHHTLYIKHYTTHHTISCTPLYFDCSLHNYLTFFRLRCRFSLCFASLRAYFMAAITIFDHFLWWLCKLHAFTHCMWRWSIRFISFLTFANAKNSSIQYFTWKDISKSKTLCLDLPVLSFLDYQGKDYLFTIISFLKCNIFILELSSINSTSN